MGVGVEVGAEAEAEVEGGAGRIRAASRNPWTKMMPPRSSPPEQLSPSTQTLNPSHSPAPRPQSPPANRLHLARSRAIQSPRRSRASSASTVRIRTWRQVRPDWRTERTREGETTVGRRRRGTRARSRMRQSPRKRTRRSNAMRTRRSKVLANPNRKAPPSPPWPRTRCLLSLVTRCLLLFLATVFLLLFILLLHLRTTIVLMQLMVSTTHTT